METLRVLVAGSMDMREMNSYKKHRCSGVIKDHRSSGKHYVTARCPPPSKYESPLDRKTENRSEMS